MNEATISKRGMVWVSRGGERSEHIIPAMLNVHGESDRAAGIIAGSVVEISLVEALECHLHPDKKITDKLFRSTGAFGAFATKIQLGFLTGLYGKNAYRDLITIKDIRNRFAHALDVNDFTTDQIRSWAMNLSLVEKHTVDMEVIPEDQESNDVWRIGIQDREQALENPRQRYICATAVFTMGFILAAETRMPEPLF